MAKRVSATTWLRCPALIGNHLDGAWHHLAATIDGPAMRLCCDGAEVCALASTAPIVHDPFVDFWVGTHGAEKPGFDFDGNIDEIRIYSRALGAD